MSQNSFFSSLDYENKNSKNKPKAILQRHEYVQRFGDWERWSKGGDICPIFCKIDKQQHKQDWENFTIELDKSKVFRNQDGDLFVRMDLLLGGKGFHYKAKELYANNNIQSEVFTTPVKDFFKKYILWKLEDPKQQDRMSEDLIKHFHQGGVCTVANRALTDFAGGKPINFSEAKQKISFEATDEGFKCSEQNKYYQIVNMSNSQKTNSNSSFLTTKVDLSVKGSQIGNGVQIDKISISTKSEVEDLFPGIEQGLISKIVQWFKGLFGIKSTNEKNPETPFISFSGMEQPNQREELDVQRPSLGK
jgi:hypothetical protein